MRAELSVPITSRGSIQNGGKDVDMTTQCGPGLDRKDLRRLETAFREFLSENLRIDQSGELVLYRETILRTPLSAKASLIALIRYWYATGA
jgi:hypothetical protein